MKNQTLQYKKTFLISVYTCKLNILLTNCAHVYFLGLLLATLHHVFCTLGSGIMWLQQFLFKNYFMHKNWDDCKHFSKIRKEIKKNPSNSVLMLCVVHHSRKKSYISDTYHSTITIIPLFSCCWSFSFFRTTLISSCHKSKNHKNSKEQKAT